MKRPKRIISNNAQLRIRNINFHLLKVFLFLFLWLISLDKFPVKYIENRNYNTMEIEHTHLHISFTHSSFITLLSTNKTIFNEPKKHKIMFLE